MANIFVKIPHAARMDPSAASAAAFGVVVTAAIIKMNIEFYFYASSNK